MERSCVLNMAGTGPILSKKNYSQERVDTAKNHLLQFMGRDHLAGLTILDIGSGSGLDSLAMIQSGARSVHGFDYDPDSVGATRHVQNLNGNPKNWTIAQGSVLDDAYMERLPRYDMVYSWGVLMATGEVWHALRNAAGRVKPGGLLYITTYTADLPHFGQPHEYWLKVKHRYVSSGWLTRRIMDLWYVWRFFRPVEPPPALDCWQDVQDNYAQSGWLTRRTMELWYIWRKFAWRRSGGAAIFNQMRSYVRRLSYIGMVSAEYQKNRGMNLFIDVRDWLGGWPMEFVHDAEVTAFCQGLGFQPVKIVTGEANTEFLFRRDGGE